MKNYLFLIPLFVTSSLFAQLQCDSLLMSVEASSPYQISMNSNADFIFGFNQQDLNYYWSITDASGNVVASDSSVVFGAYLGNNINDSLLTVTLFVEGLGVSCITTGYLSLVNQSWILQTFNNSNPTAEVDCNMLEVMVTASTPLQINMTSNASSCFPFQDTAYSFSWVMTDFNNTIIVESFLDNLSATLTDSTLESLIVCLEISDMFGNYCQICDTLVYNGPIYNWGTDNITDSISPVNCDSVETYIVESSQFQIQMSTNAPDLGDVLTYYWVSYDLNGNIIANNPAGGNSTIALNMVLDTLYTCLNIIDAFNQSCELCDTLVWDGNAWVKSTQAIANLQYTQWHEQSSLIKIIDVMGREVKPQDQKILIYMYQDGTIEKKYRIR